MYRIVEEMAAEASSASTSLARLISRRAKNDPQGFKDAVSKGDLKSYLLTETLRGKIATEAELDKFLQEHSKDLGLETPGPSSSASSSAPSSSSRGRDAEEAARKARAAADEMRRRIQSFDLEAVSLSIDTMVFDSMYDAETQGHLDAQLNTRLVELNHTGGDGLRLLGKKLEMPKVVCFVLSVVSSGYSMGALMRGNLFMFAFQAVIAHDLFRVSYNCFLKAYLLHGTRRIGASPVNFGSALLSSITSAITGAADPSTAYLREIDIELLQINTFTPVLWLKAKHWYRQQLQQPPP